MRLRRLLLLTTLLASGLAAAQVYKWVDEDGVVHFSDQPRAGAEEVELLRSPSPPGVQPGRPGAQSTPSTVATAAAPAADETVTDYQSLRVVSPAPEVTLWNIGGTLDVSLELQPALQPGHEVRLYFDGAARTVPGTSFQLEEVYRGEHTIQAEIVDERGELQIRSEGHRFYVQQTSVVGS